MSRELAFLYYCAIYGQPADMVDRYGSYFDAAAYQAAMADEFERQQYRDRIRTQILGKLRNLDFNARFTLVGSTSHDGYTSLGEYDFARHAFPVRNMPTFGYCVDAHRTAFGNCHGSVMNVDIFKITNAVNMADFTGTVSMPEADARALAKRSTLAGNRNVAARIVYSILNQKGHDADSTFGAAAIFIPFVYSVEIYTDETLSTRLGFVSKKPGSTATINEFLANDRSASDRRDEGVRAGAAALESSDPAQAEIERQRAVEAQSYRVHSFGSNGCTSDLYLKGSWNDRPIGGKVDFVDARTGAIVHTDWPGKKGGSMLSGGYYRVCRSVDSEATGIEITR